MHQHINSKQLTEQNVQNDHNFLNEKIQSDTKKETHLMCIDLHETYDTI